MNVTPFMVDLEGKQAVIVGGGRVACRKALHLMKGGARVTIISPEVHPVLQEWIRAGKIDWKQKKYTGDKLEDAWVVVAATDSADVNRRVALSARSHQLVNVVDQPELGNFHTPAKLNRGRLILAVSTGGASPTLACKIRDHLAKIYDESWEKKVEDLYQKRRS
ncbi:hypothetical protein GXN76_05295 [Kroppenstedtia pulmonis]|uniref:precorrin-2 dehydrogenase n=1 Tax=Kroppenstedtia pulmonis TaxID=1380685 RepID=A0A7D3XR30_9BACL|nr:NAD(P)-dependent oxidoreductase [Kroppenstedtia pulmonis]QKG83948.1 hypothetical protein GXN76_05295 [Kroppenstedtia pulmonis]